MMNYNYDVLNNTLTVSEKFLKLAGKYNSAEYNVVKRLRADNPNMQIVGRGPIPWGHYSRILSYK